MEFLKTEHLKTSSVKFEFFRKGEWLSKLVKMGLQHRHNWGMQKRFNLRRMIKITKETNELGTLITVTGLSKLIMCMLILAQKIILK